jgi:hypothetical protein
MALVADPATKPRRRTGVEEEIGVALIALDDR